MSASRGRTKRGGAGLVDDEDDEKATRSGCCAVGLGVRTRLVWCYCRAARGSQRARRGRGGSGRSSLASCCHRAPPPSRSAVARHRFVSTPVHDAVPPRPHHPPRSSHRPPRRSPLGPGPGPPPAHLHHLGRRPPRPAPDWAHRARPRTAPRRARPQAARPVRRPDARLLQGPLRPRQGRVPLLLHRDRSRCVRARSASSRPSTDSCPDPRRYGCCPRAGAPLPLLAPLAHPSGQFSPTSGLSLTPCLALCIAYTRSSSGASSSSALVRRARRVADLPPSTPRRTALPTRSCTPSVRSSPPPPHSRVRPTDDRSRQQRRAPSRRASVVSTPCAATPRARSAASVRRCLPLARTHLANMT